VDRTTTVRKTQAEAGMWDRHVRKRQARERDASRRGCTCSGGSERRTKCSGRRRKTFLIAVGTRGKRSSVIEQRGTQWMQVLFTRKKNGKKKILDRNL